MGEVPLGVARQTRPVPQARDPRGHGIALASTLCRVGDAAPLVDLDQRSHHVAEVDEHAAVLVPGGAGERVGGELLGDPGDLRADVQQPVAVIVLDGLRGRHEQVPPGVAELGAPHGRVLRAGRQRPGHAERVGDDLLQQLQRPAKVLQPCGLGAARVHPAALPGLAEQPPRLVDVYVDLAQPGDPGPGVFWLQVRTQAGAHLGQHRGQLPGKLVDARPGRTVAQRRPDQEVHQQADHHAHGGVQQAAGQEVGLEGGVGRQHDDAGGGDRGRLVPQPAVPAQQERDHEHRAHAQRAAVEQPAAAPGEHDAHEGRRDLLATSRDGAVDGRVHHEHGCPRGEEGLLQPEHLDRDHPRDHPGQGGLGVLQEVDHEHRVRPATDSPQAPRGAALVPERLHPRNVPIVVSTIPRTARGATARSGAGTWQHQHRERRRTVPSR